MYVEMQHSSFINIISNKEKYFCKFVFILRKYLLT